MKKTILILGLIIIMGIGSFYGIIEYINSFDKYTVTKETAPNVDAVLVLGAFVYSNGQPSPVLEDRLNYAYEMYELKKAEKIIVSGDHGTKEYDEVNVMRDYLIKLGVKKEDIFMDHAGFDTYDSMYRAKEIFLVKSLLISTQEFHITRAMYIARKLGIEAYGYPSPDKEMYSMPALYSREKLAKIKAFLEITFKRKPKFLGETIPIWSSGELTQ